MSHKKLNVFTSFELSASEEEAGQILTLEQKRVIQNKLADIAQDKLYLPFTPNDIMSYTQREAELVGQLGILQWLIDTSVQVEESIAARRAEESDL